MKSTGRTHPITLFWNDINLNPFPDGTEGEDPLLPV